MNKKNYSKVLDTGINLVKNVKTYNFGIGQIDKLKSILEKKKNEIEMKNEKVVFFIDDFFIKDRTILEILNMRDKDKVIYIDTINEPSTIKVDEYKKQLIKDGFETMEASQEVAFRAFYKKKKKIRSSQSPTRTE